MLSLSAAEIEELNKKVQFGVLGKAVYERTYSRIKPNGEKETWPETVLRVVNGNCNLVPERYIEAGEREKLFQLIYQFQAIPAGRSLWVSGVPGRQFLFNCHNSSWTEDISGHFTFLFDELCKGGGVGSNYSCRYIQHYLPVQNRFDLHIVCSQNHPDYLSVQDKLSTKFSADWTGSISIEDSREGWVQALKTLLQYFWSEPFEEREVIFDVSNIRAKGSRIKGFGGIASGPVPLIVMLQNIAALLNARYSQKLTSLDFMLLDHLIAACVISGNVRRSARMSIKSWKDPDILDFINCKLDESSHWTTNISVEIDDDFFKAWKKGNKHAKTVFNKAVEAMLTRGEPGFWNRSLSQVGETEPERIESTNPCGEIALQGFENCNLGHINLAGFDDEQQRQEAFRLMARFLIRNTFGDILNKRQKEIVSRNRRIGVGFFGYQTWLVKNGIKYSESHHNQFVIHSLKKYYQVVRNAVREYAFALRIPEPVKVTTIAPTGTIALLPGETTGIQPIYTRYGIRRIRYADNDPQLTEFAPQDIEQDIYSATTKAVKFYYKDRLVEIAEHLNFDVKDLVEQQDEIHLADMLSVQAMIQDVYADNAVSFTANILPGSLTKKEIKGILLSYLPRLKGTTIMVDESRPQAPYERVSAAEFEKHNGLIGHGNLECTNGACPIK
ncbi:ribonucleoside-triphosphate reductase adenosylcobalamin-dependent [Lucifera butyrica]|uniref:Adenosylcobalamin-dependent ribonucleoside-triphosphate reductase n=1 Tax=Lucifera butyrica TaxID=1351585 RepID=A0A498R291_9FIRM|nr:ribonucleoside-triphosphate reductase, adenosylcobalamin-dependent [Lucifera butyrica]VBB06746.1 ribonucleoside-triphosphate reductase adenosylcobalamin-dependent [Lucifera butyrica]